MTKITQQDIDNIVRLQVKITPEYHIINQIPETEVLQWLYELKYLPSEPRESLKAFLVWDNKRIIGIDTLALLCKQYQVSEPAKLVFQKLKLGGALLKNARGVVFDHCDFTYCHHLHDQTPAFIRTDHDKMNDFSTARFLNCDLHEVLFKNVTLNKAAFTNTKLSATQFLYADLANCDFESITFSRMPRFVHSNLYHSHANLHASQHNRFGQFYDKAALLGGLLISASAVIITFMMFKVIPSITVLGVLSVGLLVAGIILGYLGAASSFREKNLANKYAMFEDTVVANSETDRHILEEKQAHKIHADRRW